MSALPEPAPQEPEFDFQASTRQSRSDQPVPLGGVPRALREAAEESGIDPVAELYNEALRYANEGHLRLARERLLMLLCMSPDDGESRLLLARVHVAGQKWQDALTALDEAQGCGQTVPVQLRRTVEDHLRAEQAAQEEERSAFRAREQGEIKSLRQEARRLRSENAALLQRSTDLEREVRKWAWATAGTSAITVLFVAFNLAFGTSAAPAEAAPAPVATAAAGADPAALAAGDEGTPPTANATATAAAQALAAEDGLAGTNLEVQVKGSAAVVRGEVTSWKQKSIAEKTLKGVSDVDKVDVSQVVVLARTRGATHTVASGDSLSKISHQYYGDSTFSSKIKSANTDVLKGSDALSVGMSLRIPPVQ
jgi:nucleoid-associated protein YgaU